MLTTTMIIVWAVVIATTLLLEFFTVDFFACCFSLGALVSLILAIFGVDIVWQLIAFFAVSIVAICATRPLVKRFMKKPTVPTNVDQNFGKTTRLLADVVDGKSSIKINDVVWTAACDAELKQGDLVAIERVEGNKMIVKPAVAETVK
ncbi:MAG: NfeD family protein [Clostridia bacterium]|nr:NfeD family protein [Clostridia bacterium]